MNNAKMWYRFWQPHGELDILIEPWVGLAEYVRRLKPRKIERIVDPVRGVNANA